MGTLVRVGHSLFYDWLIAAVAMSFPKRLQSRTTHASCLQPAAASSPVAEQAAQHAQDQLQAGQQGAARPQQAQQAKQQGLDLPSLIAPLLVQRSPSADALYWKVVLLGTAGAAQQAQQQLSVLGRWLALQLSRGRLVGSPAGSAYVEGPVTLQVWAALHFSASVQKCCLFKSLGNLHATAMGVNERLLGQCVSEGMPAAHVAVGRALVVLWGSGTCVLRY